MKENVYKHLIITKTDVQDSVSVLRKTWKTIRCKVTRGKKRPGTHGIQIYRLRSRSHVRWRDFKPGGCSLCVFSLWGSSHYESITSMHAKKYIYSVCKYFEFINCIYICIISISYLSRIVQDGLFMSSIAFWHFHVRESRWIWIALQLYYCGYKAGSTLKNAGCIIISITDE